MFLSLFVFLNGCATSSVKYTAPSEKEVINEVVINEKFDVVWNRLVRKLSSDFFVINNIEKDSRIINASFSSNSPAQYIDCGISVRKFSNARGDNTYVYNPAESTRYTTTQGGHLINVNRASKLKGRVNIYVAPVLDKTTVSVNAKYVNTVNFKFYDVVHTFIKSDSFVFDLATKTPHRNPEITCFSTGRLEKMILDYAK